jgi:hypothetical protein
LAEAHLNSWNNERSRHFWHERLSHYATDFGISADHFPNAMDDWERSSGMVDGTPEFTGAISGGVSSGISFTAPVAAENLYNLGQLYPWFSPMKSN